ARIGIRAMAVFDANVLVGLIVDLAWSDRARDSVAAESVRTAPSLLAVEVGNAIWRNVRSGALSADQAGRALTHAIAIVALEPVEDLAAQALRIAIERDHPVYDCCYVALAMRDSVPLVTADRRLAALAEQAGVTVEMLATG
ncbi:MAG: type II toxin-antitoxin system VapC family toxin, partial [Bauldia sp.]|uniref:type II toxin-antitoxin system VapC family toxin n=1 Tax=Bauldia sp. TaxID=2575872 RepID=UPI001DFB28A6